MCACDAVIPTADQRETKSFLIKQLIFFANGKTDISGVLVRIL